MTPNSPRDATLSSPLEVISEDEAATQSVATDGSADNSDSRKFKMRPPKMSSFTADAPKAAEFQVIFMVRKTCLICISANVPWGN